jgi:hypothetical protein
MAGRAAGDEQQTARQWNDPGKKGVVEVHGIICVETTLSKQGQPNSLPTSVKEIPAAGGVPNRIKA